MIHSRFQVMVEPAELEGAGHEVRRADLAVGRPEGGAHRLLQDQADAPGGEQRLERPAVEEADDAALDGDADQRRRPGRPAGWRWPASSRTGQGALGADQLLHDEGGVGAEHHHLAVRHVDDAHHAEGDGEADGGEQQHRAERQAVPEVLRHVPGGEPVVDGGDGLGRGPLHACGLVAGQRRPAAPRAVLVAAVADDADGGELVGLLGIGHAAG